MLPPRLSLPILGPSSAKWVGNHAISSLVKNSRMEQASGEALAGRLLEDVIQVREQYNIMYQGINVYC